ncbi:MAG TPA: thrombospondin type 3 repeat-containing protein [Polyangia bacterium]|jgi:Ca2+-binding RTX toxin-like protein|nr:thrombospondin type 3 repeat-containing protein [Polyangia bacterium]
MTLSGSQFSTSLTGHVFANISGPPRAGARVEIARLELATQPFTFSTPALSGATVQQMYLSHQGRLRGTFVDATHFVLSAAAGQIDASFVISQSGCIDPCPDITGAIHEVNQNPITGTIDLAARTLTLDISEASGGNQIQAHVQGSVTQTPPDTDGDGVFDNADNCPRIANPSQQAIAPVVTPPAGVQTNSCTGVTLAPPAVQDVCGAGGITATSNAPFRFPLGTTTVTWTIRDRRGNVATTTQTVTVGLGDDPSCCPVGTHVIVGTSNNDILVGTSGADCIIGLGGQDQISGLGGNDFINGGDGDDVIDGGSGDDILNGGSGQDHLIGGTGNDTVLGGEGDDLLEDNSGTGTLDGGPGHNTCVASGGQKTLVNCGQ